MRFLLDRKRRSRGPKVIERTRAILADPGNPAVPCLEAEINQLVYGIYGLTTDEIELVENAIRKEAQYDRTELFLIQIFIRNKWLPSLSSHSRLDYLKSKGGVVMALSGEMEKGLKGKGRNAFRNLRAVEENVSEIIKVLVTKP